MRQPALGLCQVPFSEGELGFQGKRLREPVHCIPECILAEVLLPFDPQQDGCRGVRAQDAGLVHRHRGEVGSAESLQHSVKHSLTGPGRVTSLGDLQIRSLGTNSVVQLDRDSPGVPGRGDSAAADPARPKSLGPTLPVVGRKAIDVPVPRVECLAFAENVNVSKVVQLQCGPRSSHAGRLRIHSGSGTARQYGQVRGDGWRWLRPRPPDEEQRQRSEPDHTNPACSRAATVGLAKRAVKRGRVGPPPRRIQLEGTRQDGPGPTRDP